MVPATPRRKTIPVLIWSGEYCRRPLSWTRATSPATKPRVGYSEYWWKWITIGIGIGSRTEAVLIISAIPVWSPFRVAALPAATIIISIRTSNISDGWDLILVNLLLTRPLSRNKSNACYRQWRWWIVYSQTRTRRRRCWLCGSWCIAIKSNRQPLHTPYLIIFW